MPQNDFHVHSHRLMQSWCNAMRESQQDFVAAFYFGRLRRQNQCRPSFTYYQRTMLLRIQSGIAYSGNALKRTISGLKGTEKLIAVNGSYMTTTQERSAFCKSMPDAPSTKRPRLDGDKLVLSLAAKGDGGLRFGDWSQNPRDKPPVSVTERRAGAPGRVLRSFR